MDRVVPLNKGAGVRKWSDFRFVVHCYTVKVRMAPHGVACTSVYFRAMAPLGLAGNRRIVTECFELILSSLFSQHVFLSQFLSVNLVPRAASRA